MVGIKNQEFFYSSFPTVHNWGEDYLYQFQGFWFLPSFINGSKQVVDHFQSLSTDVILASSPKTGTTWLKSLLYSIVNRPSRSQLLTTSHPHEIVPSLELQVYGEPLSDSSPPRFPSNTSSSSRLLSTHLPYQMLSESLNSSDCRVVYIARNPKDTVVSRWHFENLISLETREPRPLEDVVSKFCAGTVIYGPYYEHVLGYHKESLERPEKFFFVTYEELKSDPKIHVKRLAEFLGCPFEGGDDMDEQVEEVVRSCSVENLKKHEVNNSTDVPSWGMMPYKSYFRKGQVGDHTNHLTEDMINRIDTITRVKFHGVNLWGEN